MSTTSPNSAERAELALIDAGAESVTADPWASDGWVDVNGDPLKGRDRPMWWKIRQTKPGPPPPHPEPVLRMEPGEYLTASGARGWGTIPKRLGDGWELREGRAIGTRLVRNKPGELVETISAQAWHKPTGARAVALLRRPYPDGGKWAFSPPALVWVHGHSVPVQVGARVYTAAVTGWPPLNEDGTAWAVATIDSTDEEE